MRLLLWLSCLPVGLTIGALGRATRRRQLSRVSRKARFEIFPAPIGPKIPEPDEVYEARSERTMEERLEALNGETTYREPLTGGGARHDTTPDEHATVAQLSYARGYCGKLGPDVALAVALRDDSRRSQCVAMLADALAAPASASDRRAFDYAAMCAWDEVVHGRKSPAPKSMPAEAWGALLRLAVGVLESERQVALRAARAAA